MSDVTSRPTCSTCHHWCPIARKAGRGECLGDLPKFANDPIDSERGAWPTTKADQGCAHHQDFEAYVAGLAGRLPLKTKAMQANGVADAAPVVVPALPQDVPQSVSQPVPQPTVQPASQAAPQAASQHAAQRPAQNGGQPAGQGSGHASGQQHARQGR